MRSIIIFPYVFLKPTLPMLLLLDLLEANSFFLNLLIEDIPLILHFWLSFSFPDEVIAPIVQIIVFVVHILQLLHWCDDFGLRFGETSYIFNKCMYIGGEAATYQKRSKRLVLLFWDICSRYRWSSLDWKSYPFPSSKRMESVSSANHNTTMSISSTYRPNSAISLMRPFISTF